MSLWAWVREVWAARNRPVEVFDDTFPDSDGWSDRIPPDADCPDTEPTSPGGLDGS